MTEDIDKILELLYGCIDTANRMLPSDAKLLKSPNTVLVGNNGVLDSLALITLLVDIEDALRTNLGVECPLIEDDLLADAQGPYRSIATLAEWITTRIS
jgi:D-alanine--poly(phosphoribitol) ligase subunit 2